jgi:SNARE domain
MHEIVTVPDVSIRAQVRRAKEHVVQGEENLRQAKKLSKNTRKWMCCALIVLLVIAAIIVVVVIEPWNTGGGGKKSGRRLLWQPPAPLLHLELALPEAAQQGAHPRIRFLN